MCNRLKHNYSLFMLVNWLMILLKWLKLFLFDSYCFCACHSKGLAGSDKPGMGSSSSWKDSHCSHSLARRASLRCFALYNIQSNSWLCDKCHSSPRLSLRCSPHEQAMDKSRRIWRHSSLRNSWAAHRRMTWYVRWEIVFRISKPFERNNNKSRNPLLNQLYARWHYIRK